MREKNPNYRIKMVDLCVCVCSMIAPCVLLPNAWTYARKPKIFFYIQCLCIDNVYLFYCLCAVFFGWILRFSIKRHQLHAHTQTPVRIHTKDVLWIGFPFKMWSYGKFKSAFMAFRLNIMDFIFLAPFFKRRKTQTSPSFIDQVTISMIYCYYVNTQSVFFSFSLFSEAHMQNGRCRSWHQLYWFY